MARTVIIEKLSRGVCNIRINRPAKRNSLDQETIACLRGTIQDFENDPDFSVAVLSGTGGNFCAGYDLNQFIDKETCMPNINNVQKLLWPLGPRLSDRKIIIAAIEGHAAGFGYELALKCDFRVGEKDSRMGFMNRRFGIPIMNGGTVILPQLIGHSRATELIATGRAQPADEALRTGLLSHISEVGCAIGRALNLARSLEKFDQPTLLHDLKSTTLTRYNHKGIDLFQKERENSIKFLQDCKPLTVAAKFLNGELCRHGTYDLGNLIRPEPEVSL